MQEHILQPTLVRTRVSLVVFINAFILHVISRILLHTRVSNPFHFGFKCKTSPILSLQHLKCYAIIMERDEGLASVAYGSLGISL